jgi:hypothetical protein
MDYLARPRYRKIDMRFGTRNVKNIYRIGSLKAVASKLVKLSEI